MSLTHFRLTMALTLLLGWGMPGWTSAQFRVVPNPDDGSVLQTQALARPTAPAPGFAYSPDPYSGGYGYPYGNYGRAGGALMGVAAVTTANAQGLNTVQQARITNQQAIQSQIDTRRRMFDELRYEQANTPTVEERREMDRLTQLQRTRNNPPTSEIWNATALNALIFNLGKVQRETGLRGPYVPLDEGLVKHINVTDGTVRTGAGLFRNGPKLTWPVDLVDARYDQDRTEINAQSAAALKQLERDGSVEPKTVRALLTAVKTLQEHIDGAVADLTPSEYTRSMRYANQLLESARTLAQPDANKFFNGKLQAKGNNVAELIDNLSRSGLSIAPATQSDEAAYTALHRILLDYDAGLTRITTR